MNLNLALAVISSQILFTVSDVLARSNLKDAGFSWATVVAPWLIVYIAVRQIAVIGQLYVHANAELGKMAGLFAATFILLNNGIGYFYLNETLTAPAYIGVSLAFLSFLLFVLYT